MNMKYSIKKINLVLGILVMAIVAICFRGKVYAADLWTNHVATNFSGGRGLDNDPYLITTSEELALLAKLCNENNNMYASANYKLMADLDIGKYEWDAIGNNSNYGDSVPFNIEYCFSGVFDGNGHTISNLTITEKRSGIYFYGLFGYVHRGEVRNLTLNNPKISIVGNETNRAEKTYCISGLAAVCSDVYASNDGKYTYDSTKKQLYNCIVKGAKISFEGNSSIIGGGICGYTFYSRIENCIAQSESTINNSAGVWFGGIVGLAGDSFYGGNVDIYNCTSNINIKSYVDTYTQGINEYGMINTWYANNVGGSVGAIAEAINNIRIENIYASGSIDARCSGYFDPSEKTIPIPPYASTFIGFGRIVYGDYILKDIVTDVRVDANNKASDFYILGGDCSSDAYYNPEDASMLLHEYERYNGLGYPSFTDYADKALIKNLVIISGPFMLVFDVSGAPSRDPIIDYLNISNDIPGKILNTKYGFSKDVWCYNGDNLVAATHNRDSMSVSKNPTCKEEGIVTYSCSSCGKGVNITIPKISSHTYDKGVITTKATKTSAGEKTYTCTICGNKYTEKYRLNVYDVFKDVSKGKWYVDGIQYVYDRGIMSGYSADKFGTTDNIKREDFACILYRIAGSPSVSGSSTFKDVRSGKYYYNAIIWCSQKGIISGYNSTKFGVGDKITREQMSAMIYRFAGYQGRKLAGGKTIDSYPDAKNVSGYAKEALEWCISAGIISGKSKDGKNYLDPKANATRAEAAAIIMRYLKL